MNPYYEFFLRGHDKTTGGGNYKYINWITEQWSEFKSMHGLDRFAGVCEELRVKFEKWLDKKTMYNN